MRKRNSIVNLPLVLGIVLSIIAHAAALYSRGLVTPAKPIMDAGRTTVQLTLIPSVASEPTPVPVAEPESPPEPIVEPEPAPVAEPEPTPKPTVEPEPIAIPKPTPTPEPRVEPAAPTPPEPTAPKSIEQDASLIADKGVQIEAAPIAPIHTQASYPRISRKRGHEGVVLLSIQVLANGSAGKVIVLESSGHKPLDDAAVKAAKKTKYTPAKRFGRAVAAEIIQPIAFQLSK